MNKTVLVLGAAGMLGHTVFRYLSQQNNLKIFGTLRQSNDLHHFPVHLHSQLISNVNVLDSDEIVEVLKKTRPDVIINCIGIIKQLSSANDPLVALPINSIFPHRLA